MTRRERQKLVRGTRYPYTIEYSTDGETWQAHSYIQTPSDERVFVAHANPQAEYRIAAHWNWNRYGELVNLDHAASYDELLDEWLRECGDAKFVAEYCDIGVCRLTPKVLPTEK